LSVTSTQHIAERPSTRVVRWAGAAALAIGLHVGGAFALLRMQADDNPDDPGSIAIELAPVITAPAVKPEDVPPGPLMQEDAPAPETPKQTKETVVSHRCKAHRWPRIASRRRK